MLRDKKLLLACAKNTAQYIKNTGGGNFAGFILDIIRYVNKQQSDSKHKVQQLWQILFNVRNTNIEIIGGGKSIKNSYIMFIDNFLGIRKIQNEYRLKNMDFVNLDLDEIYYVFAWVRRLVKDDSEKEKNEHEERRYNKSNRKYDDIKDYDTREKKKQYEPFNTQLFDQLKKLKNFNDDG